MSRRDRVLDAAITVLGTQGRRQLTHRAVDAAAGVAPGTTSNYFRTADALIDGVAQRLEALDRADWEAIAGRVPAEGTDELAQALAGYLRHALGPARARTAARFALFLEAAARPELRPSVGRTRAMVVEWGARWVSRLGSPAPASHTRLLLDYLDGVILHELAAPDPELDPLPALRDLLRRLAAGAGWPTVDAPAG